MQQPCTPGSSWKLPAAQGRAYNMYDPSLGQTMYASLVAAIYGNNIQPNVSDIPGTVCPRLLLCCLSAHEGTATCWSCCACTHHVHHSMTQGSCSRASLKLPAHLHPWWLPGMASTPL